MEENKNPMSPPPGKDTPPPIRPLPQQPQQRPQQPQQQTPQPPPPRPKAAEVRGYKRSETVALLFTAMSKAQGQMEMASKDADNPFFHSKYADMASVVGVIRKPFADNGLFFMQFPNATDEGIEVTTLIGHESGEWVESVLALPTMKIDPQGYGTAITYCCRYAIRSIAGVAPEEDDGNKATESAGKARETALKILNDAAPKGVEAFEEAFKALPPEARKLVQRDLPTIREKISGQAAKRSTSVV
jgi:ERF superfamily